MRATREECLDYIVLFRERRLLHVLKKLAVHYDEDGIIKASGNDLIAPAPRTVAGAGIRCGECLGGPLRYDYQAA